MGPGGETPLGRNRRAVVKKKEAVKRIRVFLVDDHPSTLFGLRSILAVPDMEVVGEATTGQEALAGILSDPPDVVILDCRLPDLAGCVVLTRIKAGAPQVAVVMLTAFEEPETLVDAAMGGASGFLLKTAGAKEVLSVIRRVAAGENCLPKKHWQGLYARFIAAKNPVQPGAKGGLTHRETQLLECMARGLTNKAIAEFLGISLDTVRFHSTHLFERLGVSDRTQAVAQAISKGIIAAPPGLADRF
jgi:DNA-binding NarL/FixJ family response regulator